ncbi:MAG: cytochrome c maturation protein CcmE [Rhodobacterales bacterium]|nr:MAG: cytochrome c maturation protein CcmE [Rhodobacterales bacterium]
MRGLKKRRRLQIVLLSFLFLVIATGLIGYALRDGINYYRSPAQVLEEPPEVGEVFRLGGLVEAGSLVRGEGETVRFVVTDGAASVPVEFTGILPDLFGENQGMIGMGTLVDGVFIAQEILAKHDEEYMPAEVIESLKEQGVYEPPSE